MTIEQVRVPAGVNPAALSQAPAQPEQAPIPAPTAPAVPEAAPAAAPQFTPEQLAAAAAFLQSQQAQPAQPAAPVAPEAAPSLKDVQIDDPALAAQAQLFTTFAPEVDIDRALGLAVERGDPSLIDVKYLQEVAPNKAAQLATVAKTIVSEVQRVAALGTKLAHEAAGSEANWDAAAALFKQSASEYERDFVADLLKSTDPAKLKAAAERVVEFAKAKGAQVTPAVTLQPGSAATVGGEALSAAEFRAALSKLDPMSADFAAQEAELLNRRKLGRQLGR
jgi:hypothetical protein